MCVKKFVGLLTLTFAFSASAAEEAEYVMQGRWVTTVTGKDAVICFYRAPGRTQVFSVVIPVDRLVNGQWCPDKIMVE